MDERLAQLSNKFGGLCFQRDEAQERADDLARQAEEVRTAMRHIFASVQDVQRVEEETRNPKPEGIDSDVALRMKAEAEAANKAEATRLKRETERAARNAAKAAKDEGTNGTGRRRGRPSNAERAAIETPAA